MNLFQKLKQSLKKTRQNFTNKFNSNPKKEEKIDDEFYDELEECLIMADAGTECSFSIVETLKKNIKSKRLKFKNQAKEELISILEETLSGDEDLKTSTTPTIILMLGVNGVGKTTTIAKLAHLLKNQNKSVIIGAADTFRAGAINQLAIWADRINCPLVQHKPGSDPAAVVFDTITAAKKRKIDIAICDTAGRLHNKKNLMQELQKIVNITNREAADYEKEFLLTLDATTGQNGLVQAEKFKEYGAITGTILTKLDGTSKGGIIIPIKQKLNLPIKFIGTGEDINDLQPFNARLFLNALFDVESDKPDVEDID